MTSLLLILLSIASVPGRSAANSVRIALYGGGGAILGDKDYPYQKTLEQAAESAFRNSSVTVLLEDDIRRNLTNDAFDAVFFPGGSGHAQATALGAEGLAAVRAFVSAGGGYIGTCAGAFLGMSSLLFYGEGPSGQGPPAQSLGTGTVQVEFTDQAFQDLALDRLAFSGNVTIFYMGGPVVAPESLPASVSVLAWYRSKLPSMSPGGDEGLNTPAVTSSEYGGGRVVLNSPHAEHTKSAPIGPAFYRGELEWIIRRREEIQLVSFV